MYDSDLRDEEWELVAHHFEAKDPRGRKPDHRKRDVVNAILYINKSGASGDCCLTTSRPGKQSMTIIVYGIKGMCGQRRWMSWLKCIEKKGQRCNAQLRDHRLSEYQDGLLERRAWV